MKTTPTNILLLSLIGSTCLANATQSIEAIQREVDQFIKFSLDAGGNYQISKAQIDPRLQLPACEEPLELFAQSGEIKPGQNTVGVRCNAGKAWTIYSVVSIKSFKEVLVLSKALRRNDVIRADHLTTETRDSGTLQQGYLSNADEIINKQATRNIPAGSVLNRSHYSEIFLIKRGERVSIQSGKAGLLISAPGIAMMDGAKGQQINVKNASSNRVIQATVSDIGVVSVYF